MKMDTKNKIKLTELGLGMIGTNIIYINDRNQIIASNLCMLPYFLGFLTSFKTEMKTEEYKELEKLYNEVITNTATLMKENAITDPISVFATFMYMYRNGYLSLDKKYDYSTKMKDFGNLQGLDVIRGLGVCRSVASMHSDICNELGMDSSVIMVNAKDAIPQIEKLCIKDKPIPDEKTKKFVKLVVAATKVIPTANHAITTVEKDGVNYILDPMNDGFLYMRENNELHVANNEDYFMKLNMPVTQMNRMFLNSKIKKLKGLKEQLQKPSIDYDTYKYNYQIAAETCMFNQEIFEEFYKNNKDIYEEIVRKSDEHGNMMLRMTGFDQVRKVLENEKVKPVIEKMKYNMNETKEEVKQLLKK
ncbi:MAG: hypothetical protein E7160_00575 [Firmicutes bacterium]|nr:hypothetical protein [Bacillota bacterium]